MIHKINEALLCLCNRRKWPQQARRRSRRGYYTVRSVETAMWFLHATTDGSTDAVLPLIPRCIPHAEWNVNETSYPNCTTIEFGKSFPSFAVPGFCDHFFWARPFCISALQITVPISLRERYLHCKLRSLLLRSVKEKQATQFNKWSKSCSNTSQLATALLICAVRIAFLSSFLSIYFEAT